MSAEEVTLFENALVKWGKDFFEIQKQSVSTTSLSGFEIQVTVTHLNGNEYARILAYACDCRLPCFWLRVSCANLHYTY